MASGCKRECLNEDAAESNTHHFMVVQRYNVRRLHARNACCNAVTIQYCSHASSSRSYTLSHQRRHNERLSRRDDQETNDIAQCYIQSSYAYLFAIECSIINVLETICNELKIRLLLQLNLIITLRLYAY
jgi:hypothetical protein